MDVYLALVYLNEAKEHRNAWAELKRAWMCYTGKGLPRNEAAARASLDKIHKAGRGLSAFCLAFMHETGLSIPHSQELAERYYKKAASIFNEEAQKGLATGSCNLGFLYAEGRGVEQDLEQAAIQFQIAADRGFAPAQTNLGLCYLNGWGVDPDDEKAFALFRQAADAGNRAACACAAHMLRHGLGCEPDPDLEIQLLQEGAEAGDINCWYELGVAYEVGHGVERSDKEAGRWLQLAAAEGDAKAQARLAALLIRNDPNEEQMGLALALLDRASAQGHAMAEYVLGSLYAFGGPHVQPDPPEAKEIADQLIREGNMLGHRLLGQMLEAGAGFPADPAEAVRHYVLGAKAGDWICQSHVAVAYENGRGVARSPVEACIWYRLAALVDEKGAGVAANRIMAKLSKAERQEAELLFQKRRVRVPVNRDFQMGFRQ